MFYRDMNEFQDKINKKMLENTDKTFIMRKCIKKQN